MDGLCYVASTLMMAFELFAPLGKPVCILHGSGYCTPFCYPGQGDPPAQDTPHPLWQLSVLL